MPDKTEIVPNEKPFETILTVLVAFSTVLIGVSGYLAADMGNRENDKRSEGLSSLNEANTIYLGANQIVLREIELMTEAEIAEYENRTDVAIFLRTIMTAYPDYIDAEGNGSAEYGDDIDVAWNAFTEMMYAPYDALYNESMRAFEEAEKASKKGLNLLLATVMLAVSSMLGTVGMSIGARTLRLVFIVMVAITIAASGSFIGHTLML